MKCLLIDQKFMLLKLCKPHFTLLIRNLLLLGITWCVSNCSGSGERKSTLAETNQFKEYWYAGKAEITTYNLSQSRYGENRVGKAVLIFVTEDFSGKKQVKIDNPASQDRVIVMKMNFMKNFVTGMYPYSMMLSTFSPVDRTARPHALKVVMSTQEWCGQVFSQLNLRGTYEFTGHSYFESAGEEKFNLPVAWLEDEIWTTIRLEPGDLPTGEFNLIPGLFNSRLRHSDLKIFKVNAEKTEAADASSYSMRFVEQNRILTIHYEKKFPFRISGWEESFMERGQNRSTIAVRDKTMLIDYWTKNKNEFLYLRDSLGLSPHNY